MAVAVETSFDAGMAEALLYLLRVPSLSDEDGRAGMTQVVEAEPGGEPGSFDCRPEVAGHVIAMPDRTATGGGEHMAALWEGYRAMCSPIISTKNAGSVTVRLVLVLVGPMTRAPRISDKDSTTSTVRLRRLSLGSVSAQSSPARSPV